MRELEAIFAVILLSQQCFSQPIEESVVSVYTTHPTTMGTSPPLGVYHQIANNIAERITSPIYRFLGINSTKQETTTSSWNNVELLDESDVANKHEIKPIDNDISRDRDVEEVSVDGLRKIDKKPEKFTLYSNYLPVLRQASQATDNDNNDTKNDTSKELDDPFEWETDEEVVKPREGPIVYILEFIGNIIQLLWGGLMAFSNASSGSSKDSQ